MPKIQIQGKHNPKNMKAHFVLISFVFSIILISPNGYGQYCNQEDSLALVALYTQCNGPNWTNNENWLVGPVRNWSHISVEDGRVTVILLGNNNLTGELPLELGDLTFLSRLKLYNNQLSGSLIFVIENLTKLTSLQLGDNNFTGEIPSEIGNLTELTSFNLSDNDLTGAIPSEIGSLTNLESLDLSSNQFSGEVPSEFGNLQKLSFVDLSNNEFSGAMPIELCNLIDLEHLNIENNEINELPDYSCLINLRKLNVRGNKLDFGDLEPNMGIPSESFEYLGQDMPGSQVDTLIEPGSDYPLSIDVGGLNNVYQWFRRGLKVEGATSKEYVITSATKIDQGEYACKITNTLITDLRLYSLPINILVNTGELDIFTDINADLPPLGWTVKAEWGDYDNDKDLDLLISGSNNNQLITKVFKFQNDSFVDINASLLTRYGGGAQWLDFNKDNQLDIYLSGNFSFDTLNSQMYELVDSSFNTMNIEMPQSYGTGLTQKEINWEDYDNDGDLDLLITAVRDIGTSDTYTELYETINDTLMELVNTDITGRYSSVASGDYDNDGDKDILFTGYNIVVIYRNEGGMLFSKHIELLNSYFSMGNGVWNDFDNDGDLDILVAYWNGMEVLTLFKNNNNSFIEQTNTGLIGIGPYNSLAWGDYDNDGDSDVLVCGFHDRFVVSKIFENTNGHFSIFQSLEGVSYGACNWGDYNNDGRLDVVVSGVKSSPYTDTEFNSKIYKNNTSLANTKPTVPANLGSSFSNEVAILSWNVASDNETPSAGLSYNVWLGTSPGSVDIVSPTADLATGYRKIVKTGNAGYNNFFIIKNLKPGTYYWSVQAIDKGYAGSNFAPQASFTIDAGASPFSFQGGETGLEQWQLWVYSVLMPNGESFGQGDEIAIFDNSKIVGLLKLSVAPDESNWTSSSLNAFSVLEDGSQGYIPGNAITIKAWDASADQIYFLENISFHPDWYQTHQSEYFPETWAYSYVKLFASEVKANLTGRVSSLGSPLAGATVSCGKNSATSDNNGDYIINDIVVGNYNISAQKEGYKTKTVQKCITASASNNQNFELDVWTSFYDFVGGNPSDSIWTLYISSAKIEGMDMDLQDEISIYDANTMVGHFVLNQVCTPSNFSENDLIAFSSLGNDNNGWDAGNNFNFKAYDVSENKEYSNFAALFSSDCEYNGNVFPGIEDAYSCVSFAFSIPGGKFYGNHNVENAIVSATNTLTQTVYSDTVAAGTYSFIVPEGKYNISSNALAYQSYSAALNPYTVNSGDLIELTIHMDILPANIVQNIDLSSGYSFVSRNVEPSDTDIGNLVNSIKPSLDFVSNTDGESLDNQSGLWVNNIGPWQKDEAYLFRMEASSSLSITGYLLDPSA
jgi:Carboxypeptidase regulatory-like domain/FG-GAP-like repeat/Leucine rich repeat/Leucine Rich Repeat